MSDGYEGISPERVTWFKKIFAQQHWPIWQAFHDIEHRDAQLQEQIAERQGMSLPAGFVDLGCAVMHVRQLRKHTSNLHRFQKYLPLAIELEPTVPHTQEWFAVVSKAGDIDALELTCRELADALNAQAKAIERDKRNGFGK